VNPRASRTVPFVSKAIGVPLAKVAALVMAGHKLKDLGFTQELRPRHVSVKEAVFPFVRFPGIDVILSPEMKSTGEVMGIDRNVGIAFLKSQAAAGNALPTSGNVFLSVRDSDKAAILDLARELNALGFTLYATRGTSTVLRDHGVPSRAVFRISDGRPNAIDLMEDKEVAWIVNTPSSGASPRLDEVRMRAHCVIRGIPITTTVAGMREAINGLKSLRKMEYMTVCSLQEYHRHAPRLNWQAAVRPPPASDAGTLKEPARSVRRT
jgi:carbamoyl-phosphate synthase large subunit